MPVDEIEIPPIENKTTIIVNMPDGFMTPPVDSTSDANTANEPDCEYQHFPDYYRQGATVLGCTGNVDDDSANFVCCTWLFLEEKQACEERWCRDKGDICGWELNSWQCYSY